MDQCIYLKDSGSKFTVLVLIVDDLFLASNDTGYSTRQNGFILDL